MSVLAFPGCSVKFFNRDCIIIFNPHNNSQSWRYSSQITCWEIETLGWTVCLRSCLDCESCLWRVGWQDANLGSPFPHAVTNWPWNSTPASWDNSLSWPFLCLCTLFLCWFFLVCQCLTTTFFSIASRLIKSMASDSTGVRPHLQL